MLTGQNLIGIPAISGTPLSMTRSVTSPTNGHAYGLNSIAGKWTTPGVTYVVVFYFLSIL